MQFKCISIISDLVVNQHCFFLTADADILESRVADGRYNFNCNLKLQSVKFCLFVAISVWKPGIADFCGIILIAWVVSWHGSSADESNVLRWMCCCHSLHRCGYLLYFAITDFSLHLGMHDPNNNFHRILPSEQVTSLPRLFWPTEEKKKTLK